MSSREFGQLMGHKTPPGVQIHNSRGGGMGGGVRNKEFTETEIHRIREFTGLSSWVTIQDVIKGSITICLGWVQ